MTHAELLPQIFSLSRNDQLLIVEAIRNHLAGALATPDETKFRAELERRAADAQQNPADESPLNLVMQRLRKTR